MKSLFLHIYCWVNGERNSKFGEVTGESLVTRFGLLWSVAQFLCSTLYSSNFINPWAGTTLYERAFSLHDHVLEFATRVCITTSKWLLETFVSFCHQYGSVCWHCARYKCSYYYYYYYFDTCSRPLLWPPCVADTDIIFLPCGFFFLSFSPRLISVVGDWMSTILPHMVWP